MFKNGDKYRLKHGKKNTRLYKVWVAMKQRCLNPNNKSFFKYGGRGITICDDWKNDFMCFYNWAIENGYDENAPRGKFTIDRINNNGNYEPNNCRLANMKQQSNNRRTNKYIMYNGERHTLAEWCEITNLPRTTIRRRIKMGWDIEKIFTTPKLK